MEELRKLIVGVIQEVLGDKLSQILTKAGVAFMVALAWDVLGWIWGLPLPILGLLFFASFALTLHTSSYVAPRKTKQPLTPPQQELVVPGKPRNQISVVEQPKQIEQATPVVISKAPEPPSQPEKRKSLFDFDPAKIPIKDVVDFFSHLKRAHKMNLEYSQQKEVELVQVQIRIVSLQEHMEFARLLVKVLETADYDVLVNRESASHIFIAKDKDRHDKLVVRRRKTGESLHDLVYGAVASSLIAFAAFQEDPFPSKSDRDYIQVELGGAP